MALDMVDRLIFDTFLKLNKSFFDDCDPPNTLDDLSREQLFEGTILLLWNCYPDSRSVLTSTKLPHNMATRFRTAMNIVDTIKSIGVRDEINYQTLLYGKAKELRNVLVGLIEKLPSRTSIIKREESQTALLVRKALSYNKGKEIGPLTMKYCLNGQHWKPPWGICQRLSFAGLYGNIDEAFRQTDWQRMVLCATLEFEYGFKDTTFSTENLGELCQYIKEKNSKHSSCTVLMEPKPPVPPKRHLMPAEIAFDINEAEGNEENQKSALFTALSEVKTEASEIAARITNKRITLEEQRKLQLQKSEKLRSLKSDVNRIDPRLLKIIDSPKVLASIVDYVENVAEAERRSQELQNKWLAIKTEKDCDIRKARQLYDEKMSNDPFSREIKEFKKNINELKGQIPVKKAKLNELVANAESLEKIPVNRSIYAKRIFEMVTSIGKQQEEIKKSHAENAQLQKEISNISGKLDRSFTAVEETLYKEAVRDATMQKAYRILVKIHEEYANVISAIELSRKAEQEISELNDLIFMMEQKGLDEMLGKLHSDWVAVKRENEKVIRALDRCNISIAS